MPIFQSLFRGYDVNVGKRVVSFRNWRFSTDDTALAEGLRRIARANPHDLWELDVVKEELKDGEPEDPVVIAPGKRRGRPPKNPVNMFRGVRTSEVQEGVTQ